MKQPLLGDKEKALHGFFFSYLQPKMRRQSWGQTSNLNCWFSYLPIKTAYLRG